nr:glycosyltransferase [Candidatus Aminicenantes bacterium]
PKLTPTFSDIKIAIVGSGPQEESYKRKVEQFGLENNVYFTGALKQEEVFGYIQKSAIAYSDDWSEIGFPTKIFEYMAARRAIVAKRTKAVEELLGDDNSILYSSRSELKEAFMKLMKNANLRKALGENARQGVIGNSWRNRAEELIRIYEHYSDQEE